MTQVTAEHCESGNNLTEDGSGLCIRPATERVEFTESKRGVKRTAVFDMCRGCARHWEIVSPRTVKILKAEQPA